MNSILPMFDRPLPRCPICDRAMQHKIVKRATGTINYEYINCVAGCLEIAFDRGVLMIRLGRRLETISCDGTQHDRLVANRETLDMIRLYGVRKGRTE